jgi:hypothetical protein
MRFSGSALSNTDQHAERLHDVAVQPPPFIEVIETAETRDESFCDREGWGTRPKPPPGGGWRLADFSDEKRTTWTRTRLVPSRGRP